MSLYDDGTALLKSTINEKLAGPASFSDIRTAMKEKFGDHGWIREFVKAEKGLTPSDGRKYESARKQVERWSSFDQTGKYNPDKAKASSKELIALAGRSLNVPKDGLTVMISGSQGSGRNARERSWTAHMGYQEALDFVQNPTLEAVMGNAEPDWDDAVETLFPDSEGDSGSLDDVTITIG